MDIREFIASLEEAGDITRVSGEVDWRYGIGDRTREAQAGDKKALLFENIKDYPGSKILTNGLGSFERIAIALGLDPRTPFKELVRVFGQRVSQPVEPVTVKGGAFRADIVFGTALDLTRLPVPWWNREDGGRYIGTWHLNITRDPETRVRNVGIYRMQLLNSRQAALSFSADSDIACHVAKAERRDEPLHMAVVIGAEEVLIMAASAAFQRGADEFWPAGGLKTSPIELAKCQTVDLEVPASAEIIIEGNILPGRRVNEGPFFDYQGVPSANPSACVFEATCMKVRNNPVFRGAAIGVPGAEDHILFSILSGANLLDFHGSRAKRGLENFMFARRLYKPLQKASQLRKKIMNI